MLKVLEPDSWPNPDRPALIFQDRSYNYPQLAAYATRLEDVLRSRFRPGEIVALRLPNGPQLLGLLLACLQAGIVPMPLHQGMTDAEIDGILARTQPRGLVLGAQARAGSPFSVDPELFFVVDPVGLHTDTDSPGQADRPEPTRSARGADDPAARLGLVLHTSGSSGQPKAVMHSYASVEGTLRCRRTVARFNAGSRLVVASCLTQSLGLYQALALLSSGGTMILLESYDMNRLVPALLEHRPTHLIMVVDAFDKLLHHPSIDGGSLNSLEFAAAGADRVTPRVQDRFIALTGRPLATTYGMTELSWALVNPGQRPDKSLSMGFPCADVSIRLLDDRGADVPRGSVGEIHLRSPRTMIGYLRPLNAGDTGGRLDRDGWLASGDLAFRDDDGYYWFAGRKKNVIVLSTGDNVSPVEVQNAMQSHPGVASCAVFGLKTPEGSEVIGALVVRARALSAAELRQHLRHHLSDYKIPKRIRFVSSLPVGITGKVRSGGTHARVPGTWCVHSSAPCHAT